MTRMNSLAKEQKEVKPKCRATGNSGRDGCAGDWYGGWHQKLFLKLKPLLFNSQFCLGNWDLPCFGLISCSWVLLYRGSSRDRFRSCRSSQWKLVGSLSLPEATDFFNWLSNSFLKFGESSSAISVFL
ncbi:hypothetical protein H5410_007362 [Solanum commersonii]|uniref:Uncharacterized protein n=1 Tax=Solanum commersonii TaxID=4109 RepID=A0A9J6ACA0_SOLCO|nr:hypothetical protein H5410_007362 [Solanum commersonii]